MGIMNRINAGRASSAMIIKTTPVMIPTIPVGSRS